MKLLYEVCREVNRLIVQYIIHRQYTTHQYSNIMYAIGYTVPQCNLLRTLYYYIEVLCTDGI